MALNPPFAELEERSDFWFVVFFTIEMALKVIAYGVCGHKKAYLRSPWNCLDFVVVVTGIASVVMQASLGPEASERFGVFQALRAVRVLRPLRTISRVPGMRVIVHSLLDAVPQLAGVMVLFLFVLLIFGVVGIQLFHGLLHTRCYVDQLAVRELAGTVLCRPGGGHGIGCVIEASLPAVETPLPPLLLGYSAPVPPTMLRVHELRLSWNASASSGAPPPSLRVIIEAQGVSSSFELFAEPTSPLPLLSSTLTPTAPPSPSSPPGSPPPLPPPLLPLPSSALCSTPPQPGRRYIASLPKGGVLSESLTITLNSSCATTVSASGGAAAAAAASAYVELLSLELLASESAPVDDEQMCCDTASRDDFSDDQCSLGHTCGASERCLWDARNPNGVNSFDNMGFALLTIFQAMSLEGWTDIMYMLQDAWSSVVALYFVLLVAIGSFYLINLFLAVIFESFSSAVDNQRLEDRIQAKVMKKAAHRFSLANLKKVLVAHAAGTISRSEKLMTLLLARSERFSRITEHRWFQRVTFLMILLNTAILCGYHHNMSYELEQGLEYSNLVLTELFTCELFCNIAGSGVYEFFGVPFNLFDTLIVGTSQLEAVLFLMSAGHCEQYRRSTYALNRCRGGDGIGNFSVLRAFRLLRFLKLAHSLPGLRQIVATLAKSVYSMANLLFILILLMFIFALLGMELWAGRFTPDTHFPEAVCLGANVSQTTPCAGAEVPAIRWHFENFLYAFVTTFVVISGEEWHNIYFDCYEVLGSSGWLAHIYFLMLYMLGNTVVLSLFIAIMLQNHDVAYDVKDLELIKKGSSIRRVILSYRSRAPKVLQPLLLCKVPTTAPSLRPPKADAPDEGDSNEFNDPLSPDASSGAEESATSLCSSDSPAPTGAPTLSNDKRNTKSVRLEDVNTYRLKGAPGAPPRPVAQREESVATYQRNMLQAKPAAATDISSGKTVDVAPAAAKPSLAVSMVPLDSALGAPSSQRSAPLTPTARANRFIKSMIERRSRQQEEGAPAAEQHGWAMMRQVTHKPPNKSRGQMRKESLTAMLPSRLARALTSSIGGKKASENERDKWDPLMEFGWAGRSRGFSDEAGFSGRNSARSFNNSTRALAAPTQRPMKEYIPLLDRDLSLCHFSRDHPLRAAALRLLDSKLFDNVILTLIIVSSICLAIPLSEYPSYEDRCLDNPNDVHACHVHSTLSILDDIFTALFSLEAATKILALGLCIPSPTAYLRDPWNVLDFLVVVLSLVTVGYKHALPATNGEAVLVTVAADPNAALAVSTERTTNSLASLKALRAMRCLRPLRIISRNSGMRLVVGALLRALPGVANVFLVMTSLLLIFGILGVQLFMGRFSQCTVPNVWTDTECEGDAFVPTGYVWHAGCVVPGIHTREECDADPRYAWSCPDFGDFDNVLSAVKTLFEISGIERWPEVMFHGMDTVGIDMAPRRDATPGLAVFFIAWIFIGAFCVNNLVVGVVVANFTQIKEQEDSVALMTKGQREWVDTLNRSTKLQPRKTYRPKASQPRRRAIWHFVRHTYFELCVQFLIVLNVALMLLYFCEAQPGPLGPGVGNGQCVVPKWNENLQRYSNFVFTFLYLMEAVLKITAYGRAYFWLTAWNNFDFTLVVTSLMDVGLEIASSATSFDLTNSAIINPATLRSFKIVRISRLLRLIRHATRLRILITAFVSALPALFNVGSLLVLLLFVFAVLGVSLFSHVPFGMYVNVHANFRTLQMAFLTLFRAVTGETWNGLMRECERVDSSWAVIYFIAFNLTASFILLNLVIAVILENYGTSVDDAGREVPQEILEQYREEWERLDPEATGNISSDRLMLLLRRVREPLGFKTAQGYEITRASQMHFMAELGKSLHDHGGMVNFQILLQALTQYAHAHGEYKHDAAKDGSDLPADSTLQTRVTRQLRAALKAAHAYDLPPPTYTQAELHAALTLQAAWRGRQTKRAQKSGTESFNARRTSSSNSGFSSFRNRRPTHAFCDSCDGACERHSTITRATASVARRTMTMARGASRSITRKMTRSPVRRPPSSLSEQLKRVVEDARALDSARKGTPREGRTFTIGFAEPSTLDVEKRPSLQDAGRAVLHDARSLPPRLSHDSRPCCSTSELSHDVGALLVPFDDECIPRCRRLRVPTASLYRVDATTEGIFVKKETSARTVSSSPSVSDSPSKSSLATSFVWPFSGPREDAPTAAAAPALGATCPPECTWPPKLEAGPYRWVPAKQERTDADEVGQSTTITITYDPDSNGVGLLDGSRVVTDPEVALSHIRRHLRPPSASASESAKLEVRQSKAVVPAPAAIKEDETVTDRSFAKRERERNTSKQLVQNV